MKNNARIDNIAKIRVIDQIKVQIRCTQDTLFKNSIFNILSRVSDAGFGFLFWMVASRLYSIEDVGLATALLSIVAIIISFSRLGFDVSQIRYIKKYDNSVLFNTCLLIPALFAIVLSIIYLTYISYISPSLAFIQGHGISFILFVLVNSITLTIGTAFLSLRRSDIRFGQNLILALRIPLLFVLITLGSMGIFFSSCIAYLISTIIALILISQFVRVQLDVNGQFIRETLRYSITNYAANLLQGLPGLLFPIFILNLIDPKSAALYFIASAIGNLVLIIPDAVALSFFVEGAHGIDMKNGIAKSFIAIYLLIIPIIALLIIFGRSILGLFGDDYTSANNLLQLIAISSLAVTVYQIFIIVLNLNMKMREILLITLFRCVLLLGLSYVLVNYSGLIGIGWAWIITYTIISALIALVSIRLLKQHPENSLNGDPFKSELRMI